MNRTRPDPTALLIQKLPECIDPNQYPEEFVLASLFLLSARRNLNAHWIQISSKHTFQEIKNTSLRTNEFKKFLLNYASNSFFESKYSFFFNKREVISKFFDYLLVGRWKDIPASSIESLLQWKTKRYHLQLFDFLPKPFELLQMQAQGVRCVTVFRTEKDLSLIHEHDRDAFLFTVHDLEHAHRFFSCPKNFEMQKKLAYVYSLAFLHGPWKNFWSEKSLPLFNYLISDMNTHPQHSLQTLRSLWIHEWKSRTNTPLIEKLSGPNEKQMNQSWGDFIQFLDQCSNPALLEVRLPPVGPQRSLEGT